MRIVTDGEGNYAIAKYRWIFTIYKDLHTKGFWWSKNSEYFHACWGSKEKVLQILNTKKPKKITDVKF